MFLARIAFFRLHESPRYLVHAGRPQEALVSLQMISRFNGSDLTINLEDVHDHQLAGALVPNDDCAITQAQDTNGELEESRLPEYDQRDLDSSQMHANIDAVDANGHPSATPPSTNVLSARVEIKNYHATRDFPPVLDEYSATAAQSAIPPLGLDPPAASSDPILGSDPLSPIVNQSASIAGPPYDLLRATPTRRRHSSHVSGRPRRSSVLSEKRVSIAFSRWIRRPLLAWLDRVAMVLSPQWVKITLLVWSVWFSMSLGMFSFHNSLPQSLTPRPVWRAQGTLCSMYSYRSCSKLKRAPKRL
jgi:hypothetical protein